MHPHETSAFGCLLWREAATKNKKRGSGLAIYDLTLEAAEARSY